MSLSRLIREIEKGPLPRRPPTLRELGIPFREPVPAREALGSLDDEFWEALNKLHFGLSYDADALQAGAEDFTVGVFRALGIYDKESTGV